MTIPGQTSRRALDVAPPAVSSAAAVLGALIEAGREIERRDGAPERAVRGAAALAGRTRAKLHEGIPALAGEPLLDGATLRANTALVLDALERTATSAATARALRETLLGDAARAAIDWDALAAVSIAGDGDEAHAALARLGAGDAALVVLDHAARPVLRHAAASIRDAVAESRWHRGTCPACGSAPLLAELRSRDGERERVLRCGRCATGWPFDHLRCPACGADDHRMRRRLHREGEEESRRVDCCGGCGGYVKSIAALDELPWDALLRRDLETAWLDEAASGVRR